MPVSTGCRLREWGYHKLSRLWRIIVRNGSRIMLNVGC